MGHGSFISIFSEAHKFRVASRRFLRFPAAVVLFAFQRASKRYDYVF